VLLGLSSHGQVQLTELLAPLRPIQMLQLARDRWAHFARVEVWEEAVCVLRLPPAFEIRGMEPAVVEPCAPRSAKA
jgi:hypothetical protein